MQENILKFIENTGKIDGQICSLLGWNRNKITDIRRGKSKFTIEDIKKFQKVSKLPPNSRYPNFYLTKGFITGVYELPEGLKKKGS